MNKLFQMLLVAMAITVAMPTMAQEDKAALKAKKAEEKAAKKEANAKKRREKINSYVWNWDGTLSGNETFDSYLKTVTDINNDIKEFESMFVGYVYNQDTVQIKDKYYIMAYMTDSAGNMITRNTTNWQIANSVAAGTAIVLEATTASLATASATLALTEMGLGAIAFAPYIKGGPMIIAKGMQQIGDIAKLNKTIARQWKAAKNGAIDPATLGVFDDDVIKKMNKCCYFKEIADTDPIYAVASEETVVEETAAAPTPKVYSDAEMGQMLAAMPVAPEDANRVSDDIPDDVMIEDGLGNLFINKNQIYFLA